MQSARQAERLIAMHRRSALVSLGAASSWLVSGCTSVPGAVLNDRYCFRTQTTRFRPACTPGPIPDAATDTLAKRFEPVPGRLVIYVVRHRWGDYVNVVQVGFVGGRMVSTVPLSLVRLVAAPGVHRLAFSWAKGNGELEVRGEAGQVLLVDLVGSLWIWNEWYRWETGDPSIRERALKSRLVADLSLAGP